MQQTGRPTQYQRVGIFISTDSQSSGGEGRPTEGRPTTEREDMIISMKLGATKKEIDHVCERLQEFGYSAHVITGVERVVIGAVGSGKNKEQVMESIEAAPGVDSVVPVSQPFKFVSREA